MHLETKKTILWFNLEVTEIFRKYLGTKKVGKNYPSTFPKVIFFFNYQFVYLPETQATLQKLFKHKTKKLEMKD